MEKETAVQWFYKNLKNYKTLNLTDKLIQDLYKQAMQMEHEYHQKLADDAYRLGWESHKTFTA